MKALLLILLVLTVAPSLDAQEELYPVWLTKDLIVTDTGCTMMFPTGGQYGQHTLSFGLDPSKGEPDSVGFHVSGDAEFYAYSEWLEGNHWTLGYARPRDGMITFKYSKQSEGHRSKNVGIALHPHTKDFGKNQYYICVKAAFAWYPTARIEEEIADRFTSVQQVKWYYYDGREADFYGTEKELKASGRRGIFFSILGKSILLE